jgi:small nuclear ribonucleoprotein D3
MILSDLRANFPFLFLFLIYLLLLTVIMTAKDGRQMKLENVFLRGGQIKFIVLPELLKNSPLLKKVQTLKAKKVEPDEKRGGLGPNAKKPRKA